MHRIARSTPFLIVGLIFLGWGAVEFYQTTIGPRLHSLDGVSY